MSLGKKLLGAAGRRVRALLGRSEPVMDTEIRAGYYHPGGTVLDDELDTEFTTSDGRVIPVYRNYRYAVKPGWRYFAELNTLQLLCERGVAARDDCEFLRLAAGYRTLTVPVEQVRERVDTLMLKHPELFVETNSENQESTVLKPSGQEIESVLQKHVDSHKAMLDELGRLGIYHHQKGHRMLEIGFIGGGYSIFAFERLGFKAFGVDNCYGGQVLRAPLPEYLKQALSSDVEFAAGDITARTPFDDGSFELIYSSSVLEHVQDLPAAFAELKRLLAPGGVMVHGYHPFYCVDGGHALGILDSPWAHVRLSREDYLRYIQELRPHESSVASEWITGALNPTPMHRMQQLVTSTGLDIRLWRAGFGKKRKGMAGREIIREALFKHEGLTLHDLFCNNVFFAATL